MANVVCLLIILATFSIAIITLYHPLPEKSETLVNKVIDLSLVGVIGYLFTKSKI